MSTGDGLQPVADFFYLFVVVYVVRSDFFFIGPGVSRWFWSLREPIHLLKALS